MFEDENGKAVKLCFVPHGRRFQIFNVHGKPFGLVFTLIHDGQSIDKKVPLDQNNGWYRHLDNLPIVSYGRRVGKIGRGDFHLSNYVFLHNEHRNDPIKRSNKMALNIAALMRDDTRTIEVVFDRGGRSYTYITHLEVSLGDLVVVPVGDEGKTKLAHVNGVHDGLNIDPNDTMVFGWVIAVVDLTEYSKNMEKNQEIETLVSQAQRKNMRNSFAQNVLAMVDPDKRREIEAVINTKTIQGIEAPTPKK